MNLSRFFTNHVAADLPAEKRESVLIISASDITRAGLRVLLREQLGITDVYYLSSVEQLVPSSAGHAVSLVIVDEEMQSGSRMPLKWINELPGFGDSALMLISSTRSLADVTEMIRRGAKACVSSRLPQQQIAEAMQAALNGQWWVPEEHRYAFRMKERPHSEPVLPGVAALESLTPLEQVVVRKLLHGMTVKEVSEEHGRSIKTVSGQKMSALRKLGARDLVDVYRMLGSVPDFTG